MKRVTIAAGVAAVVLAAAIIPRLTKKEQFAQPVMDSVVEVANPERGDIAVQSAVVGTIGAEESVSVSLKAGGDVTEVYVKAGDTVEEGAALFSIDTKQVDSAKNNLDSAALQFSQAKDELSRQQVLYNGGGISDQAYKQYQDAVASAQINYNNAKLNYDNQLSYSEITAPISGTVETVNIEKLDSVQQGTIACVISGGGAKTVNFSVSDRISKNLTDGDVIEVEKDGTKYSGNIYEVSSMADSSTGLFNIKAKLSDSADSALLSTGSMVKLYVTSEKASDVLKIPVNSVYYDGGLSYVYTYDQAEGCLHKVEVKTGIYDSEYIEIDSGLSEDDQVLITWSSELYDGVKVRLKGESSAASANADADINSDANTDTNTDAPRPEIKEDVKNDNKPNAGGEKAMDKPSEKTE